MYRSKHLHQRNELPTGPASSAPAAGSTAPSQPNTRARRATRQSDDDFLAHYFRRIDPAVAASFTKEQRIAMRIMFGDRGATRHAVDVRCTFPLGWRRFYLVLLLGRDRRKFIRPRNGLPGELGDWLTYLVMLMGLLAALFLLLSLLKV